MAETIEMGRLNPETSSPEQPQLRRYYKIMKQNLRAHN